LVTVFWCYWFRYVLLLWWLLLTTSYSILIQSSLLNTMTLTKLC
jgi:hypothetical protein